MRIKVFVFELNTYHLDILPLYRAQLPALFDEKKISIHYFLNIAIAKRAETILGGRVTRLGNKLLRYACPSKIMRAFFYRHAIQKLIDHHKPDVIVFNTLEPKPYHEIFKALDHPIKIGLVHNLKTYNSHDKIKSDTEFLFCLHKHNYVTLNKAGRKVDGYIVPFHRCLDIVKTRHEIDQIEIAVPGIISYNRRNYLLLIQLAERFSLHNHSTKITFNILTDSTQRDGPDLRKRIEEKNLQKYFRFHRWLSDVNFFTQLANAHYVMPILNHGRGTYALGKVSIAFGHSGAYGVPLILDERTAEIWGLDKKNGLIYDSLDNLVKLLLTKKVDRHSLSQEYNLFIKRQIEENREFLGNLSKSHKIFSRFRD
tara:strand:+ start:1605 stop:2711 length:1107 start_codon:yes stop_codon:yes gene_type:complete